MSSNEKKLLFKVPEVTLFFWGIKILATTLGETGGDLLSMSFKFGYLVSTGILLVIFLFSVITQVRAKSFSPALYWFTMIATTTVGTTLADYVTRSLGIGYAGGSLLLLVLLVLTFIIWYQNLGAKGFAPIKDVKSESFYWVTIMFSQTLGTALGDWTADTEGVGYLWSAILFGSVLVSLGILYLKTKVNRQWLFWSAFILTRPLGAVVGDFLDKPLEKGGLALDRGSASLVLLVGMSFLIILEVVIKTLSSKKVNNQKG